MKIPFVDRLLRRKKRAEYVKRKVVDITPDQARIQRELDYMRRIGGHNPQLGKLQARIRKRRV